MIHDHLKIYLAATERIASARLVLAEAEAYKELVLKYLADTTTSIKETQLDLQAKLTPADYQAEIEAAIEKANGT